MARLSLLPHDVSFSGSTRPRIECELNFGGAGSPFVGADVSLVVYDAILYIATPAFHDERTHATGDDQNLGMPGFMSDNFFLAPTSVSAGEASADPDVTPGNGVLFVMRGTLQRAKNKTWFIRITSPIKQTQSPVLAIDLHMRDEKGRMCPVGTIGYVAADVGRSRELLFRVAQFLPPPSTCKVVAASLGKQGGGRTNASVLVDPPVQGSGSDTTIGGKPLEKTFPAPTATSRVVSPDLTGFYDSMDDPAKLRPICVEFNQAGGRVAGWVSDVPRGFPSTISAFPSAQVLLRIADAPVVVPTDADGKTASIPFPRLVVLCGDMNNNASSWPFTWWVPEKVGGVGPDPDREPEVIDVGLQEKGLIGRGRISIAPGSSASEGNPALTIRFDTPFGPFGPWTLVRTRKESRWPTALVQELPKLSVPLSPQVIDDVQAYLTATQVRPLPQAYWQFMASVLSTNNSELMDAVTQWTSSSMGVVRDVGRSRVSSQLELLFFTNDPGYKQAIRDGARATASTVLLPHGDGKHSLLEWFIIMADDFFAGVRASNPSASNADIFSRLEQGFQDLEIRPDGQFQYTLEFHQASAGAQLVVGFTAVGYVATITRQTFVNGNAVDDPTFGDATFVGAALDVEAGAAVSAGVSPGGPFLGTAKFQTDDRLDPADFKHAFVKQTGITAGKVGLGPAGFTAFESNFLVVTLQNGVELSTSKTETLQRKFNVFKLLTKDWGKLLKVKANAVSVHFVSTILLSPQELGSSLPPPDQPNGVLPLDRDVSRTTHILFDYDSATLKSRDELELRLAVDRRLFTQPEGASVFVAGYASPEGRESYNQTLSEARATAVQQAIRDAFGADLTLRPNALKVVGFGEDPAINEGHLLNPPGDTEEERATIRKQSVNDWPLWRKVDLRVRGVLVVRVMARGAGGTPP